MASKTPDTKFTEALGRIWNEYPGGMLDITEESIMSKDLDALAVEQSEPEAVNGTEVTKGDIMAWEDMEKLRQDVLFQLKWVITGCLIGKVGAESRS